MTQAEALGIMHGGASILLTGAAGTGKTYTLNRFIKEAKSKGKKVAITATTGLAATHIGGTTIHSWSGLGIRDEISSSFVKNLPKGRLDILNKADILVIDEVSMLHDYRLDLVNELLKLARNSTEYFGGVQVILCGDLFQLPPVNHSNDRLQGGFITNSQSWQDGFFDVCYLTEQFRAKKDNNFNNFLNNMRTGKIMRSELTMLQSRIDTELAREIEPTRLYTHNANVEYLNELELQKLQTESQDYEMIKSGKTPYIDNLQKSVLVPEKLTLKLGAKVMFVKNSPDKKYVNGSLGEVIDFAKGSQMPVVKLSNGTIVVANYENWDLMDGDKKRATVTQIPLRLAWAITVHKCQGMTLDSAVIDLTKAFVEGMGYVALSRVGSFDDFSLMGLNGMALRMSLEAIEIEKHLQNQSSQSLKRHASAIADYQTKVDNQETEIIDTSKLSTIGKMRLTYPNAFKRWSVNEDNLLLEKFNAGANLEELIHALGRQPNAIKIRVASLVNEAASERL